jgi:hypothetical protein
VDTNHIDANPDSTYHPDADSDADSTYLPDADLDPDPNFQIKAQNLEKVLKCIPYVLACHLQIDADPVPDPAYHFDADPDFYLMRIRVDNTACTNRYRYRRLMFGQGFPRRAQKLSSPNIPRNVHT